MKAVGWHGANDVRIETVPDPKILNPHNAILKVTSATICGSDLHIYDGYIPTMQPGDIIGHEFIGEIVDIGSEVRQLKKAIASLSLPSWVFTKATKCLNTNKITASKFC